MSADGQLNPYSVGVVEADLGWEVRIRDASGAAVSTRPCVSEAEARTYASTVAQHIYWLSPAKFREYYRISAPAEQAGG